MKRLFRQPVFILLLWVTSALCAAGASSAEGRRGIAATVHPIATDAAIRALERGGNAVDAAIAAGLMLGVVDGYNSGIGGGCFMLIRLADGAVVALDGREKAPMRATRDMFIRDGKADTRLSQTGPLAAGVPGSLAAYEHASRQFGKLRLREHLLDAAAVAERGFAIDETYARRLAGATGDLKRFEPSRSIFIGANGQPFKAGDVLRQRDLAATYRAVAEQGTDWFYRGPFARMTAAWMRDNGGIMSEEDFANYSVRLREPVVSRYRGHQIIGFPPPSSGGVHVAQILNIVEGFDLRVMGAGSADMIHAVAEAMKLAFADRAYWLGDPDFAKVPKGLIAPDYAAALRRKIDLKKAIAVPGHGEPPGGMEDHFGKHTTHFTAADADGNWVACTATINTSFGSKVVIPGTGVVLNNQMDDFSLEPGVPNFFGLVGNEANAVAPSKRPLSSMSPTIVLKEGQPVFSAGAAGGPTIISQTVLNLIYTLDFDMEPGITLAMPRFHHQWRPDELRVEERAGREVTKALESRGHKVSVVPSIGVSQAIGFRARDAVFTGASDPRVEGKAAGF